MTERSLEVAGFTVYTSPVGSAQHRGDLATLTTRGIPFPHQYRGGTAPAARWCRVVKDDEFISGFLLLIERSRAVPGARLLRVERAGRMLHAPIAEHFGPLLSGLAKADKGALRLNVELFDEDTSRRMKLSHALAAEGFHHVHGRSYSDTLRLDLTRGVDAAFAAFSWSTRRNVRRARRQGLQVAPIADAAYIARCAWLHDEAFRRTAHGAPPFDGARLLASSDGHEACLLGVFAASATPSPATLIAFAWVQSHGDYASYAVAGSARAADLRGATPGDLLMMACIEWAIERGHRWFDLGGVTGGAGEPNDPLAGISAFKRGFSRDEIAVGEEWELRPNSLLHSAERAVRSVRSTIGRLRS